MSESSETPLTDPVDSFRPPMRDDERPKMTEKVRWALDQVKKARPLVAKWAKLARECDQFAAGDHFSRETKALLERDGRMTSAFNAAQKWISYVSGIEEQSQVEIRFLPRDIHSDPNGIASELVSKAVEWALDNCDGRFERSRAFEDMVRRGMGWTNTTLERGNDVSGIITLRRIDGMEMFWDTNSEGQNLLDARWIARIRQIPRRDAMMRWPDAKNAIASAAGRQNEAEKPGESTLINEKEAVPESEGRQSSLKPGHVEVMEFQWREEMPGIYFYDPLKDKDDWLSEKEWPVYQRKYRVLAGKLRSRAGDPTNPYKPEERAKLMSLPEEIELSDRQWMNFYKQMLIIGNECVASATLPGQRFTFNCMTGRWDAEKRIWYGVFKYLLDPQRYMTKFANQIMEIIVRSPKAGVLIEEDAVDNPAQFEQEYARIGSASVVRSGGLAKVKDKPSPQLPQGSVEMFGVCRDMMKDVTGINPEVQMGMGAADQPAMTMRQRQGAGLLMVTREFSSLGRYREHEARTIFDFLTLVADNRWFRVGGPYDAQSLQLVREPFFLEYDVVMDEGPRDPQARVIAWQELKDIYPTLGKSGLSPRLFVDYMHFLPASDRLKIKQEIDKQLEQKKAMAAQGITDGGRGKPVSIDEVKERVHTLRAKATLDEAKAAKLMADAQGTKGQQLLEAIIKGSEHGLKRDDHRMQMQRDERKHEMEVQKQGIDTGQQVLGGFMDLAKIAAQTASAQMRPQGDNGEGE